MAGRQKRIAIVNDVTGFGRCSAAVELPLVSALKVQGCILPTALLSVHSGFPDFWQMDLTAAMRPYLDSWKANGLRFDGFLTGWIGSSAQVDFVMEAIRDLAEPGATVVVDPVMGDYGRLYASYTPEMCAKMRELLAVADVVTPNLTEACQLLGREYPAGGLVSDAELGEMAAALSARGPRRIVVTGLAAESAGTIRNYVWERGQKPETVSVERIGGDRSGNGDAFASILAASLVKGEALVPSVRKAVEFIRKVLVRTVDMGLPWNHGLAFEECLVELR